MQAGQQESAETHRQPHRDAAQLGAEIHDAQHEFPQHGARRKAQESERHSADREQRRAPPAPGSGHQQQGRQHAQHDGENLQREQQPPRFEGELSADLENPQNPLGREGVGAFEIQAGFELREKRPRPRRRGVPVQVASLLRGFALGHAVSAHHQRETFHVAERIEVGAQRGDPLLHVLANAVAGQRPAPARRARVVGCFVAIGAALPVAGVHVNVALHVHEKQAAQQARPAAHPQFLRLRLADPRHEDVVRPQRHAEQTLTRLGLHAHLAAGIADHHKRGILLQEPADALVVMHATVHQPHRHVLEKARQRERLEKSRHTRRRGDRVPQPDAVGFVGQRGIAVIHPPQPIVAVDRGVDGAGRLAHEGGGELPVVPGVERRRVEDEHRHLCPPIPVVVARVEAGGPVLRLDDEVAHPERRLLPRCPFLRISDAGKKFLFVKLADPVRPRIVGVEGHPHIGPPFRRDAGANVRLDAREKLLRHALHDADVILPLDFPVRLRFQELFHLKVVMRADNRAARHAREHLHAPQQIELGEPREDADVEKRRAKAAAGKGHAHLADERALGRSFIAGEARDEPPSGGVALSPAILQPRQRRELPRRALVFPRLRADLLGLFEPERRLRIIFHAKRRFAKRGVIPPRIGQPGVLLSLHEAGENPQNFLPNRPRLPLPHFHCGRNRTGGVARPLLLREAVEDKGRIDGRVAVVRGEAHGEAAQVISERPVEVPPLPVRLPLAFVNRARDAQRFLIPRLLQRFPFAEDLQGPLQPRREQLVRILVGIKRMLRDKLASGGLRRVQAGERPGAREEFSREAEFIVLRERLRELQQRVGIGRGTAEKIGRFSDQHSAILRRTGARRR